jgi:hypothetical protein
MFERREAECGTDWPALRLARPDQGKVQQARELLAPVTGGSLRGLKRAI